MRLRSPTIPKHVQIRDRLRERILADYKPGMRLPPEAEFFKQLGVSSTTVVRALNDLVREGVIHRRRGSGTYVADRQNPPLIPGRQLKLGILWTHAVVPSEFESFCGRISRGILRGLGIASVDCEFEQDQATNVTRARWPLPQRALTVECLGSPLVESARTPNLNAVLTPGFDGVIAIGIRDEAYLDAILASGCPVTILDFPTQRLCDRADVIFANPQAGFRSAIDAFIAKGLRRIHFVGALSFDPEHRVADASPTRGTSFVRHIDPDSFLRLSAYRQAMDAHGIAVPDTFVHFTKPDSLELPAFFAGLPEYERPQALICHDAAIGERLQGGCAMLGLKVEVAGGSEFPVAGNVTSICLDSGAMGEVAAQTLVARLQQPRRPFLNIGVRMTAMERTAIENGFGGMSGT